MMSHPKPKILLNILMNILVFVALVPSAAAQTSTLPNPIAFGRLNCPAGRNRHRWQGTGRGQGRRMGFPDAAGALPARRAGHVAGNPALGQKSHYHSLHGRCAMDGTVADYRLRLRQRPGSQTKS